MLARHKTKLYWVVGLTGTYMMAEVVGSLVTGSLALLADAGFMFTYLVAVRLALAAIRLGERPATDRKSFGYYRAEVLAALANAVLMGLIFAYIIWRRSSVSLTRGTCWAARVDRRCHGSARPARLDDHQRDRRPERPRRHIRT